VTATSAVPNQASPEAAAQVRRILTGMRLSQAVSVAASLGIADVLADGPRSADDVAAAVGGDPSTTYRLLRTLAAGGIFHEGAGRTFSLTELGVALRSDVAGSVRDQAIIFGKPYMLAAWGNFEHSVRTGENAFTALHGEDVWAYRARDPNEESDFNRAMASISAPIGPALAAGYDFGAIGTLADLGGGSGTLLAAVLSAHPRLRGILFDQPAVVAESGPILARAGVADRTEVVGGDFFASVPTADAYVMKSILHDWTDEDSIRILRTIRAAAAPSARLLIVERVLGGPNDDLEGKLMDLHMLVMPGGLERTADEWRDLFAAGGWTLGGISPIGGGFQLIEGVPAA
jgi:O-methyltransferase/methyltransferase family protein